MNFTSSTSRRLIRAQADSMIGAAKIEHARAITIEDEIARRGITIKRVGAELIGPCPVCGGRDRFAIHTTKQLWHCRNCGVGGSS